jgi:hypothetical protein
LLTAARLIESRPDEIDGNRYEILTPAAEALRDRHPLAAVLLWRAMIDYALDQGRSSRYGHASDHLMDCATLDSDIADYGAFQSHTGYFEKLYVTHERKTSFWAKVR